MHKLVIWVLFSLFYTPLSIAEELVFEHRQDRLTGHYLQPINGKPAKAILLFVHGDGTTAYDADGYYDIIWQPLRENGYAIFSWDKPNVGDSTGNWLAQSMADRQSEVLAAVDAVQNKYHFRANNTGLIGFSQAGWVVPALSSRVDKIGFSIGIGFASNWISQGSYYAETRVRLQGGDQQQIGAALDDYSLSIDLFRTSPSYAQYLKWAGEDPMSAGRYQFVLNNFQSDAVADYKKIKVPSLFLWGAEDLNVNARAEFNWWQQHPHPLVNTKLMADANHAMLKADTFNTQSYGLKQWLELMWLDRDAVASDFFATVLLWLEGLNMKSNISQVDN
ncbi:MAG: alpha/beta hydrolase [Pseudomonadales bacterium]|nr:alpha/beta hydrolase [Pseudomonadales bacterium]NRA16753.1 alpha/beta hydrolase [Oceanospirillaceae bacterium]